MVEVLFQTFSPIVDHIIKNFKFLYEVDEVLIFCHCHLLIFGKSFRVWLTHFIRLKYLYIRYYISTANIRMLIYTK